MQTFSSEVGNAKIDWPRHRNDKRTATKESILRRTALKMARKNDIRKP